MTSAVLANVAALSVSPINTNTVLTEQYVGQTLASMTRDELRASATALGVKPGKDKENTIKNIVAAIVDNKVRFSTQFFPFGTTTRTLPSPPRCTARNSAPTRPTRSSNPSSACKTPSSHNPNRGTTERWCPSFKKSFSETMNP